MIYRREMFNKRELNSLLQTLDLSAHNFAKLEEEGYFSVNRYESDLLYINKKINEKLENDDDFLRKFLSVNTYYVRLFHMENGNYVIPFVNTSLSNNTTIIVLHGKSLDVQIKSMETSNVNIINLEPGTAFTFSSDIFIGYTSDDCYYCTLEHVSKFNDTDINLIYSDLMLSIKNMKEFPKALSVIEAENNPAYLISRAMQRLENRFDTTSKMRLFANFKREA